MSRFTDRVSSDLHHIAERANPSAGAWDSIRTQIDEAPDHSEGDTIIVLEPEQPRSARQTRALVALIGVAAVVLLILGALALFGDDDESGTVITDVPDPTAEPEQATPAAEQPAPTPEPADEEEGVSNDVEKATTNLPVEVVGLGAEFGVPDVSIDIDPGGLPFVTYYNALTTRLVVVDCLDAFCESRTTSPILQPSYPNGRPSVVFDQLGLPVIATAELEPGQPNNFVVLRTCRDEACVRLSDVRVEERWGASAAITPGGEVLVASSYVWNLFPDPETSPDGFLLSRCESPGCADGWSETRMSGPSFGRLISLTVNTDGLPQGAYVLGGLDSNVSVSICTDPSCAVVETTIIYDLEPPELATRAKLDAAVGRDGTTAILVDAGSRITLITWQTDPDAATTVELEIEGQIDEAPLRSSALAVDADGRAVGAYVVTTGDTDELRVAACAEPSCASGTIATVARGNIVGAVDIAVRPSGNPVLVYRDPLDVNISSCADPACTDGALEVRSW